MLDLTFVEHYAFFELRNIDWDTMTLEARSNLTSNSTEDEFFDAFASILGPLDDETVGLESDTDFFSSMPNDIDSKRMNEFEEQNTISDFDTFMLMQRDTWVQIVSAYMDGGVNGEPGGFVWVLSNTSDTSIGYMQMLDFDPDSIDEFVTELNKAFVTLADTSAMVVGIRVNFGGLDTIALKIASYCASKCTLAFTNCVIKGDETKVYIEPETRPTDENKNLV